MVHMHTSYIVSPTTCERLEAYMHVLNDIMLVIIYINFVVFLYAVRVSQWVCFNRYYWVFYAKQFNAWISSNKL